MIRREAEGTRSLALGLVEDGQVMLRFDIGVARAMLNSLALKAAGKPIEGAGMDPKLAQTAFWRWCGRQTEWGPRAATRA